MKRNMLVLFTILSVFTWVSAASALYVEVGSFSFDDPSTGLSASAVFMQDQAAKDLQITLTNTGVGALLNSDILTALFWKSTTDGLAPVSADGYKVNDTISSGTPPKTILTNSRVDDVVWQYKDSLSLYGNDQGVSTAGFDGLFGQSNFPKTFNINVDGQDYGIVRSLAANTNIPATLGPLVADEVVFHLGLASEAMISIEQVSFQYGTALNEPHYNVPILSTLLLLGSGLFAMGLVGWRRRSKTA